MDIKDFTKKNFNIYHLVGMLVCVGFSVVYWLKSGQFSESILKNNLFLMIVWGLMLGYVAADLSFNAKNRNDKE